MSQFKLALAGVSALALSSAASAAVVGTSGPQTITTPITITLDADTSYTFSLTAPGDPQNQARVSVATSGDAMIYGNSDFFGGRPASLQQGVVIPNQLSLGSWKSYSSPSAIDFSVAVTQIALMFTLADGVHYGYAQVGGNQLLAFAYETDVLGSITTAEAITGPFPGGGTEVPEPAALALLGLGVLGVAAARRRRAA